MDVNIHSPVSRVCWLEERRSCRRVRSGATSNSGRYPGARPDHVQARVETPGTITFVADVGEEGLGDLRGMKSLFFDTLRGQIDKFVSVDGAGLGIDRKSTR